jgi:glycosyltransferase involved in cell wall biosynthesis
MSARPKLSVIICIYNMVREAPRTILSAAVPYQKDVSPGDYEVILVDNGSSCPLPDETIDNLPEGVRLVSKANPHPSPVFAMNWAARELATGDIIMFAIDGARIFSDRLYATTIEAHNTVKNAFVYAFAWHLGPKVQSASTQEGYNTDVEDRLIADSGWPENSRALFDICALGASCREGYFRPIGGSNTFSMPRGLLKVVGGYDERFVSPGGGLANREIFERYVTRPGAVNVCLLSEGSFHQVHGGAATSRTYTPEYFREEYRSLFDREHRRPDYRSFYFSGGGKEYVRFVQPLTRPKKRRKPRPGLLSRLKARVRTLLRPPQSRAASRLQ